MKKIFLIVIFMFSIFIKNTFAETIYGNYYKTDSIVSLKEDEIKIDSYKIYNTYKIEYEDMGYILENKEYLKDEDDFIYEEKIVNNYTDGDVFIKINTNLKKLRYLNLGHISESFKIYEIEMFIDNKKFDYKTQFNALGKNNREDISNINDGNYDTYFINDSYDNIISFNLDGSRNLNDIKLIIHTKNSDKGAFEFYLERYKNIELNNSVDRKYYISFNYTNDYVEDVEYFYKEKIKLYKHYKENKVILNNYVSIGDNLIFDDYQIVEEYYKRDKIVLSDNLVINNKNIKIDDFIEYSSGEVNITCNIDYSVNGVYQCTFILNDINIEKNVYVNIKENEEYLKEENIHNKEVYEENKSLEEVINKIEVETIDENNQEKNKSELRIKESIEIINTNKIQKNNKVLKEITTTKKIINNNKQENNKEKIINLNHNIDINKELVKVNNTKMYRIIKSTILIILIFLTIILIIKKKRI